MEILKQILIYLFIVIVVFNGMIFVHELGHYWAAKWRGLKISRFQIWFGKPIWEKNINGVPFSLGSIPLGGFVSLPQMAPMEMVEGQENEDEESEAQEKTKEITPLDKIIVAFAGPLFSALLGFIGTLGIFFLGKPANIAPSTYIGYISPDSPAEKAGLQVGDQIMAINGKSVDSWEGTTFGISTEIKLSEGDKIYFTINRPGEDTPLEIASGFEIPETKWFERQALRRVGIGPDTFTKVYGVIENSPAHLAGLQAGDELIKINGEKVFLESQFNKWVQSGETTLNLTVIRDGSETNLQMELFTPTNMEEMIPGVYWEFVNKDFVYPNPLEQCAQSFNWISRTLSAFFNPNNDVGIGQSMSVVGIVHVQAQIFQQEHGFNVLLWFFVMINFNLALFNLFPIPVLDGGHITIAIIEWIKGKPVSAKVLLPITNFFAIILLSFMVYVLSKDIGALIGGNKPSEVTIEAPIFPEPKNTPSE